MGVGRYIGLLSVTSEKLNWFLFDTNTGAVESSTSNCSS